VEAQTLGDCVSRRWRTIWEIIPVLNNDRLPGADPARISEEIEATSASTSK